MSNSSPLLQALLEIRVKVDELEDELIDELEDIKAKIFEDKPDIAYGMLTSMVNALKREDEE